MHKGMELWTSFISPRRLNIESFFCEGGELDDILPILILARIEGYYAHPSSIYGRRKVSGF